MGTGLPFLPTDSTCELPLLSHALPKDRNSPYRVAFVLALESFEQSLCDEPGSGLAARWIVDRLARYLKSFFEVTPGREVIFGVVTNLQECVFVAVQAREPDEYDSERTYQPFHSSVVEIENVARELASFCASTPRALGLNPLLMQSPDLTVESFLCKEKMGVLLRASWRGVPVALKLSGYKDALDLECALLLYLETRGVENVPKIHRDAQTNLYPICDQSCVVYSTMYIIDDFFMQMFVSFFHSLCDFYSMFQFRPRRGQLV